MMSGNLVDHGDLQPVRFKSRQPGCWILSSSFWIRVGEPRDDQRRQVLRKLLELYRYRVSSYDIYVAQTAAVTGILVIAAK